MANFRQFFSHEEELSDEIKRADNSNPQTGDVLEFDSTGGIIAAAPSGGTNPTAHTIPISNGTPDAFVDSPIILEASPAELVVNSQICFPNQANSRLLVGATDGNKYWLQIGSDGNIIAPAIRVPEPISAPAPVSSFGARNRSSALTVDESMITGGITPYQYQWAYSSDGVTFTAISGATSATYTATHTDDGGLGDGQYRVIISDSSTSATAIVPDPIIQTIAVDLNEGPTGSISIAPGTYNINTAHNVTTNAADSDGTITSRVLAFQIGSGAFTNIYSITGAGSRTDSFTIPAAADNQTITFRLSLSDDNGQSDTITESIQVNDAINGIANYNSPGFTFSSGGTPVNPGTESSNTFATATNNVPSGTSFTDTETYTLTRSVTNTITARTRTCSYTRNPQNGGAADTCGPDSGDASAPTRNVGGNYTQTRSTANPNNVQTGLTRSVTRTGTGNYSFNVSETANSITTAQTVTYSIAGATTSFSGGVGGATYAWTITGGTPATATGTSVTVTPSGAAGTTITATANGSLSGAAGTTFTHSANNSTSVTAATVTGSFTYNNLPANTTLASSVATYSALENSNATWSFTLTAAAGYQFAGGATSRTFTGTRTATGANFTIDMTTEAGSNTPTAITYTATMSWVDNVNPAVAVSFTQPDVSMTGTIGQTVTFTDPTITVNPDYTFTGAFAGDSLTYTFGAANATLTRTVSGNATLTPRTFNISFSIPTGLQIAGGAAATDTFTGTLGQAFSISRTYEAQAGRILPSITGATENGDGTVATNGLTVTYSGNVPSGGFTQANVAVTVTGGAQTPSTTANAGTTGSTTAVGSTVTNVFGRPGDLGKNAIFNNTFYTPIFNVQRTSNDLPLTYTYTTIPTNWALRAGATNTFAGRTFGSLDSFTGNALAFNWTGSSPTQTTDPNPGDTFTWVLQWTSNSGQTGTISHTLTAT